MSISNRHRIALRFEFSRHIAPETAEQIIRTWLSGAIMCTSADFRLIPKRKPKKQETK